MNRYPSTFNEAKNHEYSYWVNKPVKQMNDPNTKKGQFENINKRLLYSSHEPIDVKMLDWKSVDLNNNEELNEVTNFINNNYVVDDKEKFSLFYEAHFIKWALGLTGELLVLKYGSHIIGTVGFTIRNMIVESHTGTFGEVNFLCVHPKYRTINVKKENKSTKQLVHVLIDESVRRIVNKGTTKGIFTTEKYIPTPSAAIRFYHRPLNYKKLFKYKFTILSGDIESVHARFSEKVEPQDYYKEATKEHLKDILVLYNEYTIKYNISIKYSEEELEHYLFSPHTKTYIMKSKNGDIVDFVSYYLLSQSVLGTTEKIKGAYLFLYSCNKEEIQLLASNVIRLVVRDTDCDVFNATDVMNNSDFLLSTTKFADEESDQEDYEKSYDHKFIKGSGKLNLNFFNFGTSRMQSGQICWTSF
jgi:glycylpeptide N-tetradecanoyltransferase